MLDSALSEESEMASLYSMLEGGENGELHNEIIDYFYYCQIRSQGENTMDVRIDVFHADSPCIP